MPHNFGHGGLDSLINRNLDFSPFTGKIERLQSRFDIYASTCPFPFIAAGLVVNPEIRAQSEQYLPIAEIAAVFNHLYRSSLTYPPILSSTPFHNALSWADVFVALQPRFQITPNPAMLLNALLLDHDFLTEFLFASFLPRRFYGGFGRYPRQREFITGWLGSGGTKRVRCLDAACGTAEDTYNLARLLIETGYPARDVQIEGWTLEPLEVWSASERRFPHDIDRELRFREWTGGVVDQGYAGSISFLCVDLRTPQPEKPFDLIICNGLLGGPIINDRQSMEVVVGYLAGILAPEGVLLAADHFHDGWKQQCPQQELQALFTLNRLRPVEIGEGIGGLKLHQ